MHQKET